MWCLPTILCIKSGMLDISKGMRTKVVYLNGDNIHVISVNIILHFIYISSIFNTSVAV